MGKILHIITLSEWGGAQQICFDLATNFDKEKFFVEVACKAGGPLVEKLREKGIKVHEMSSFRREISPINDIKTLIRLCKLIKRGRYDIIHCHSTKAGLLGRVAARIAGCKQNYFTVHGWGFYNQEEYGWANKLIVFLERILAKYTTAVICVSENDRKAGLKVKIAKDKITVIKNGTKWEVRETKEEAKKKLGITNKGTVFGMVGRFAYPKDPLTILKAAKIVIQDCPETKFILIGGGPLFGGCKIFVNKNKLENNVLLLGDRPPEETRELLLGFDVFVLISKFEGLPISIIEAMFAGLPVISSDVGGVPEIVYDQQNGFLIKNNDVGMLVEKMTFLIKNPQLQLLMGKESKRIACNEFDINNMLKSYETLMTKDHKER